MLRKHVIFVGNNKATSQENGSEERYKIRKSLCLEERTSLI